MTEEHEYADCHMSMALQQVRHHDGIKNCIDLRIEDDAGKVIFQTKFYDLAIFQLWSESFAEFAKYAETMRWHGYEAACSEADLPVVDLESFEAGLDDFLKEITEND